jgi:hypothetical protein
MSARRPPSGIRPLFDLKRIETVRRELDDVDNALLDQWVAQLPARQPLSGRDQHMHEKHGLHEEKSRFHRRFRPVS